MRWTYHFIDDFFRGRSLGDESTKHSKSWLLVVGVGALQCLLDLLIDLLCCRVGLIEFLLSFGDLPNALFDYFGGSISNEFSIVFEGFENDLVVVLLAEELIKGDHFLFETELS